MTASSNVKLIRIGTASCGMAAGAGAVLELLKQHAGGIPLEEVGCIGHCYAEPLVEVVTDQGSVMYADVKPTEEAVKNILELGEKNRFAVPAGRQSKELVRVLKLAGRIDPVRPSSVRKKVFCPSVPVSRSFSPGVSTAVPPSSRYTGRIFATVR